MSQPQSAKPGLRKRWEKLKYGIESYAVEAAAIAKGAVPLFTSGVVVRGGGLRTKKFFVEGVYRYGFTTARQLWYAAQVAPNNTAIIDDLGKRTYREAMDDVEALARVLLQRGYGEGTRIGVMARNSRAIVYPIAAKGLIGAGIYLLNVFSSPTQLRNSIAEHQLDVLFIDEEFVGRLPEDFTACDVVIGHAEDVYHPRSPRPEWQTFQQLIDAAPTAQQQPLPRRPRKGEIVIMSSGTSGTPKGVVIPEPFLPTPVPSIVTWVPWRAEMVVQQSASIFHAWGWANMNLVLAHRGVLLLRRIFDPQQAMDDLVKYRVNALITSPIFTKEQLRVAQSGDYDVSSVELISSSGNAMSEELVRGLQQKFGNVVSNFYGSTENSSCAIATPDDLQQFPRMAGRPINGVRVRILDDEGNVLPPNTVGRIYCRGALTMKRYTNPRDKAKMVIKRGLLEIGDKGYLDEEGRLFVMGRNDDMIIVGGENVYPRSVEEVLERMPGIRDLFVKGVADDKTFARLAVWIVKEDDATGAALTPEKVQSFVADELAEHSIPRDVIFMDRLPRNPTGKVMPRMLPATQEEANAQRA